jgi:hypothetical protein
MPFLFTCPHCESQTLVEDRLAGESGPCATCGKSITIQRPERNLGRGRQRGANAPSPQSIQLMITLLISALLFLGVLGWLTTNVLIPRLTPLVAGPSLQTSANLARIGAALQAYHQVHGRFPPSYLTDDQGVPAHSWRVLILPYLGETTLYARYRFDEPWDGPNNSLLAMQMPAVFASPDDVADPQLGITSFLAITGPGTPFPPGQSTSLADITDDPGDTLLVAESAESDIHWLQPDDLSVSRMTFRVNGPPRFSIRRHGGTNPPHVLLADGRVRRLRVTIPARMLQGMTTVRGFEVIDWSVAEAR